MLFLLLVIILGLFIVFIIFFVYIYFLAFKLAHLQNLGISDSLLFFQLTALINDYTKISVYLLFIILFLLFICLLLVIYNYISKIKKK